MASARFQFREGTLHRYAKIGSRKHIQDTFKNKSKSSVREILEQREGSHQETVLHVASHYGHEDIVDDLLKRGADVNQVDIDGWTALHYACHNDQLEVAERLLLEKSSFPRALTNRGDSCLHFLVCNQVQDAVIFYRVLQQFLKKGAQIDLKNPDGNTPLHMAAIRGRSQALLFLLNAGADKSTTNNSGDTPLHYAVKAGHVDCVKVLIALGASLDEKCLELSQRHPSIFEFLSHLNTNPKSVNTWRIGKPVSRRSLEAITFLSKCNLLNLPQAAVQRMKDTSSVVSRTPSPERRSKPRSQSPDTSPPDEVIPHRRWSAPRGSISPQKPTVPMDNGDLINV